MLNLKRKTMSTNDVKMWLRAVLEGRVKPGDEMWRRIWREGEFGEVRRVLREVGMQKAGDVAFDRERMWRAIEAYRGEGRNRRHVGRRWGWVAAVVALAVGGGMLAWQLGSEREEVMLTSSGVIEAGRSRAVLILPEGERIDLSDVVADTLIERNGMEIRLDSARGLTYRVARGDEERDVEWNRVVVPRKGEYRVVLADGSVVYLNSDSELRFPTSFEGGERRVWLRGEGYFEVERDAARPFVVTTEAIAVRVLGTRFNVNAYEGEPGVRTTLVEGRVRVDGRRGGDGMVLVPGEQATWKEGQLSKRRVNVEAVVAWIEGRFYFEEGATLEEIAAQLERWYDVDFFFASEDVKHLVFAGVIKKEYSANEIFEIIEKTTRVTFAVNGRTVVVSRRE